MAEATVRAMLERVGYTDASTAFRKSELKDFVNRKFYAPNFEAALKETYDRVEKPFFLTQVKVSSSVYDTSWTMDFVVFDKETFPRGLCIECKTQSVSGSVDEKYVFVEKSLLNVSNINKCTTLFYLTGGEIRACVEEYLNKANGRELHFNFTTTEAGLKRFLEKGPSVAPQTQMGLF